MIEWAQVKNIVSRHNMVRDTAAASPWDGLVLGNADMGAVVFGPAHKLAFRLTKMDLFDARWNAENYRDPLPLSQFKEFIFRESTKLNSGQCVPIDLNDCWQGNGALYPCMRMACDFLVRVGHGEPLAIAMEQRLDLATGLYEATFPVGWWRARPITCTAFVSWHRNVLAVRLQMPGLPNRVVLSLGRDSYGGRSWELLSPGRSLRGPARNRFRRDPREGMLPPAEIVTDNNTASLWQVIPGDDHCPQRGVAAVVTCSPEHAEFFMEPSGQAVVEGLEHEELTFFVALASEMEGPDSMTRATKLSRDAARDGWNSLYAEHAAAWQRFWTRSIVDLADKTLEQSWVRGCYELAVNARSGRPAPGLFGVKTVFDCPPWRGDRHNNYPEYSARFWGAFPTNHEQQALNYTEFVHGYLPTARRIAREVFECDAGAAYPMCYIDGSRKYYFHYAWGRSLFVTALHAQNCWWHYQYFGDHEFLRTMAYPVMRECADFYVELIKKNSPGDYTLWPTIATEIRGWTKGFEFNRNCIEDLAHVKFLMRAVLEASQILDTDADKRRTWQDILDNLPSYPTIVVDGKEEFVDFAGQHERPTYNHSVPMAVFWPAEDPDVYLDPGLRQVGINTLNAHAWDGTRLDVACMRLGLLEKLWGTVPRPDDPGADETVPEHDLPGHPKTMFVITEMLLTSWDGIVRVFPAWPLAEKAQFQGLRAKGAFLVSAACDAGDITAISVTSEKGNTITMHEPWPATTVVCETTGTDVQTTRHNGLIRWRTSSGDRFKLIPANGEHVATACH